MGLEPTAPRSRVKNSTTEPLCSVKNKTKKTSWYPEVSVVILDCVCVDALRPTAPVNNVAVISGPVTKCLAQGHNAGGYL